MIDTTSAILDVLNPVAQLESDLKGLAPLPARRERYRGDDLLDAWDRFNADFIERGISDGFPLVPPTRERVQSALTTVTLAPDHVLGILAPFYGAATVEKLAINAVMAGCAPSHLQVLIAAVEAILQTPQSVFPVRGITMSTNPTTMMMVVNGPILHELEINTGRCTLGPGKPARVNTVLGRALRLILMNVGHCYPGSGDMDTIGSPTKYSMCVGENEEQNPWEPFHVERGFRADQSTVTLFGANSMVHYNNYQADAQKVLLGWAGKMACVGGSGGLIPSRTEGEGGSCNVMLLAPDHARLLAEAGQTKASIRHYLFENATIQVKQILATMGVGWESLSSELQQEISSLDPESWVPQLSMPQQVQMVVVGGPNGQSDLVPCMGNPTITREIVHGRS